ncbi:growth-regulated alpha protein-like [Antennarius striatus]|uniref:growth-regulated alpha protein-like n=1 Tax=Antennarius striatus TaxID=241820 RepID=UPI0035B4DCA0
MHSSSVGIPQCIKEGNPWSWTSSRLQTEETVEPEPQPAASMNTAVITLLVCLLVFHAQGQRSNLSGKCSCLNGYIDHIPQRLIRAGPFIHRPSIFCSRTEIIVKTQNNKEKCINPLSALGKRILRKEKKDAVTSTRASSTSTTYTTSRL